jgi:hypothetical protein
VPIISSDTYGFQLRPDLTSGFEIVTPTVMPLSNTKGIDERIDRVRVYDSQGNLKHSYLRDKLGCRFLDNLPGIEDDFEYMLRLHRERE